MPAVLQRGLPCTPPDDTPSYKCCHQCTFAQTLFQHTQQLPFKIFYYRTNHLCPISHGHTNNWSSKNKNAFLPKTEKGIKTPVLNNKGATSHRSQEYYFIKTGSSSGSDSTPSLHLPKVILSGICSRLIFTAAGPHRLIPISLLSSRTCFYIQLLEFSTTYLLTYMI